MKVIESTRCIRHGKCQAMKDIVNNNKKINKINNNILNNNKIKELNKIEFPIDEYNELI